MKKRNRYLVFAFLIMMASCTDDNNDPGVDNPTTDDRSRYAGSWICAENTGQTFSITISLVGSEDSINIKNFSNFGSTANAIGLVAGNSLTIPGQNISITSVFVQGTGIMNSAGTKITMDYVADGDTISATCTKN